MFGSQHILPILLQISFVSSALENLVLHFALHRRGSRFVHHEPANLTRLVDHLAQTESRYARTYRAAEKNRLVRRWRPEYDEMSMFDELGLNHRWYFDLTVGDPPQSLAIDIDMLSPDWYSVMTSSGKGSKYDTFMSTTHVSGDRHIHPYCRLTSDTFHLHPSGNADRLDWPICQVSHSSRHTLHKSGTILGLAPNNQQHRSILSRLEHPSLLYQLYEKGLISQPIWSITLLDSTTGVLTLGGTAASEIEEAKVRTEVELKYLGQENVQDTQIENEVHNKMALLGSRIEKHFKWIDVHGSQGWWMGLINGVWVNGVKILKNQPFLLDLSFPFIHAPSAVYNHFYNTIPGCQPVTDIFYAFPCLNPPHIALEIGGWNFEILGESTRADSLHGPTGGRFSLGKINDLTALTDADSVVGVQNAKNETEVNSGYCVGIVVGTDMGTRNQEEWRQSGMKDVWVLGEPVFRGLGIVFDDGGGNDEGKARMGFRSF